MGVAAKFRGIIYAIQITDHARTRMVERSISDQLLLTVIETGRVKAKPRQPNAFWTFAEVAGRTDNLVCVSLVIESEDLVVKTVLVNWRPK